jgi:Na+/proline symporter
MVDFYQRFRRGAADDARDLRTSRLLTAAWGVFACLVALQAGRLGSAIEVVNRLGSYFYGSILGVFGLAILAPRADARGAFWGLLAGIATVATVAQTTSVGFLWLNPIGALTVFGVGLVLRRRER